MVRISHSLLSVVVIALSSFACAQQAGQTQTPPPQTPRQALIEMLRGGGEAISKHLTVEMQEVVKGYKITQGKLGATTAPKSNTTKQSAKSQDQVLPEPHTEVHTSSGDIGMIGSYLSVLGMPATENKDLQTFDSGPVLLTYTDPNAKEKMEVHVENDDLRSTEDDIQLSIHMFRDGQEQNIPFLGGVTVGMKLQEGIWRLNEIKAEVKATVGDPKFFADMQKAFQTPASDKATGIGVDLAGVKEKQEEHTHPPITSTMEMLAMAEDMYARSNPDIGFTCDLNDLLGPKSGGVFSQYLDPQIATGTANGYHFSISGCNTRPSEIFHLVAEPLNPGGKAYCINSTHTLRTADDGRGATCLATGKSSAD
jgi:hypothetical protein